jgi:anti-anti-sigma regulatory factor
MLNVTVANIGELAVIGCEGRIVQSESAYKLREAVTSQTDAHIYVLELSEVRAIGGGGLGMLAFLQRWAREHNIRLLLFHPSKAVESRQNMPNQSQSFTSLLSKKCGLFWPMPTADTR